MMLLMLLMLLMMLLLKNKIKNKRLTFAANSYRLKSGINRNFNSIKTNMERKIKFRRLHCDSFIYSDEENCCVFWSGLSEKEKESLCQFTGFFDKNGKEIYKEVLGNVYENPELINK